MPRQFKSYKFELKPNATQEVLLNKTFGCARVIWNGLTANFNGVHPSFVGPVKPNPKTVKEYRARYPFMKEVCSQSLASITGRFEEFKSQFFNKSRKTKIGRPQFKKKGHKQSFMVRKGVFSFKKGSFNPSKVDPDTGEIIGWNQHTLTSHIKFQKLGWVKCHQTRLMTGNIMSRFATISKCSLGKFWISITVEEDIEHLPKTGKSVGIDLGIKELLTLSTGVKHPNPHFFVKSQDKLAKVQRRMAKKVKGSNRYRKMRLKYAKIHARTARQRDALYHNISLNLVKDFDVICLETLNVAGMKKNRCLAKAISDVSFYKLVSMIEYKAAWYGKEVLKVSMWFPSSKTCFKCGHKKETLGLDERTYVCSKCGHTMDRDLNAALNIEQEALRVRSAQRTLSDRKTLVGFESNPTNADCVEASTYKQ